MQASTFRAIFFCLSITGSSIGFTQEILLHPVLLDVGNQNDFKPDSPRRLAASRSAATATLPLTQWFDASSRKGTGFYLFYNQVQVRQLPAAFVVQKIKRTITSVSKDGSRDTKTSFLIEAIKLNNGWLKKPDQHFGSFEIQSQERRIIRKECEVGVVSQIAGVDVDVKKWQWGDGEMYQKLHDYKDTPSEAPTLTFSCSRQWDFEFVITDTGGFSLSVPELGYSTVVSVPAALEKNSDANTGTLRLKAGLGLNSIKVGVSTLSDAVAELGEPVAVHPQKNGNRNVEFSNGLITHVDTNDVVMTIMNAPGYHIQAESNGRIVSVGETKDKIVQTLGEPIRHGSGDQAFSYEGLIIWFDADTATKIVISKPREPR